MTLTPKGLRIKRITDFSWFYNLNTPNKYMDLIININKNKKGAISPCYSFFQRAAAAFQAVLTGTALLG
jgi:hypothetical protein